MSLKLLCYMTGFIIQHTLLSLSKRMRQIMVEELSRIRTRVALEATKRNRNNAPDKSPSTPVRFGIGDEWGVPDRYFIRWVQTPASFQCWRGDETPVWPINPRHGKPKRQRNQRFAEELRGDLGTFGAKAMQRVNHRDPRCPESDQQSY
jgi:hypothetical protein